jgi:hypothetical protein
LAGEQQRAEDLKADRDRWAVQGEQLVATVDPLKNTIETLKAALNHVQFESDNFCGLGWAGSVPI